MLYCISTSLLCVLSFNSPSLAIPLCQTISHIFSFSTNNAPTNIKDATQSRCQPPCPPHQGPFFSFISIPKINPIHTLHKPLCHPLSTTPQQSINQFFTRSHTQSTILPQHIIILQPQTNPTNQNHPKHIMCLREYARFTACSCVHFWRMRNCQWAECDGEDGSIITPFDGERCQNCQRRDSGY